MDTNTLYVLLGAGAGGFVQGLSGFAFGLVAMGFWAWFLPPQLAGPMVVFGSLIGQLLSIGTIRRGFDGPRILPFVVGGVVGVPVGVFLLGYLNPVIFKAGVGALLLIYCPAMLLVRELPRVRIGGRLADGAVGFAGGVMGGLAGLNGPAPTLWCTLRAWNADAQRAVFQTFSLVTQMLTLALYALSGVLTAETLRMFVLIAPAMLVPTVIGTRLYPRIGEVAFRRLILALLSLSGLALLASAVPRMVLG